jgi:tRNA threonylcarbamoyladenosine biosynthesis protein TsaB
LLDLKEELRGYSSPVVLVGDGADLCWRVFGEEIPGLSLAPEHLRYQHAHGVAAAAEEKIARSETVSDAQLVPVYLRLSQAERELKNKS